MSDNSKPDGVRRFGRKDRKERLPPSTPLFPQYQENAPAQPAKPADAPMPEPDFDALLPNNDSAALDSLASLPPDSVRPLVIAPPEQRYPPLPPEKPAAADAPPLHEEAAASSPVPRRSGRNIVYNVITLLAIFGTVSMIVIYTIIWNEPQSYLNPFPPDVRYAFVTATPGVAPADIGTPAPDTPLATPTFEAEASPVSAFPFVLRDASLVYIANANGRGCEWSSIAGTITDIEGRALNGYRVRVTGSNFDETVFSGAALTFGDGGFEMPLGNAAAAGEYVVQLFSPQGAPLSDGYPVTSVADCERNVALINLVQSR